MANSLGGLEHVFRMESGAGKENTVGGEGVPRDRQIQILAQPEALTQSLTRATRNNNKHILLDSETAFTRAGEK